MTFFSFNFTSAPSPSSSSAPSPSSLHALMASEGKHKEKPPPSPFSSSLSFKDSSSLSYKHSSSSAMNLSSFLRCFRFVVFVVLCYLLWLRLLLYTFAPPAQAAACRNPAGPSPPPACDPAIAPFYIHKLHPRFNAALLQRCLTRPASLDASCPHLGLRGLGRPLLRLPGGVDDDAAASAAPGAVEATSWYATHPLAAELLFHARAENHPCRTSDPAEAVLFFVPFYAGLHFAAGSRQRNHTLRDALAVGLAEHLSSLPAFRRHGGRHHFLAVGRAPRYFMRDPDHPDSGTSRLLLLPELANMTVLTVERHPRGGRNQFGIPYPSFFHPHTAADVADWQAELRQLERDRLFAVVGGQRPSSEAAAAVGTVGIMEQCWRSRRCLAVDCEATAGGCGDADRVLDVMRRADFCLQPPPGESFAGRSTFDSVLAGCIPVFFSETAYAQYEWYVPERPEEWSVFLKREQWGRVEEELHRIPRAEVERMRAAVIELIPKMAYAHPESNPSELGYRDAVDVALVELTKRVQSTLQNNL